MSNIIWITNSKPDCADCKSAQARKSDDGIHFDDKEQGFYPVFMEEERLKKAVNYYGGNVIKFERPQVLLIEVSPPIFMSLPDSISSEVKVR